MTRNNNSTSDRQQSKYQIEILHMVRVESMLKRGEYVNADLLASALRNCGMKPIPSDVLNYLCRFLEGKEKRRKGRKPMPQFEETRHKIWMSLMSDYYEQTLKDWQDAENGFYWRKGEARTGASAYRRPPLNEVAARETAETFLYGEESWRTVQNMISKFKKDVK